MVDALAWLLAIELMGLLALPFCFVLFSRLPDRGLTLAKPLALVLFSYLLWLTGLTHLAPNTRITIIMILVLGAVAGDCVMYFIGHHFGRSWLREHPFLARHLTPERERQIEEKIRQHGLKVFFLARFMLGVRAPIYITCGIMRVPFRRFLFADAISASVVVSLVFGLSYWFGEDVRIWIKRSEWAITIIVAIVVIVVVIVMYRKYRRRHRAAAQPTDVERPGPHAADADADASSERSSEPPC